MKINKRFQEFVDQENRFAEIFDREKITWPLSQENVDRLFCSLESKLSPENLSCDGEIRGAKLVSKRNKLEGVVKDLEKYCLAYGRKISKVCY